MVLPVTAFKEFLILLLIDKWNDKYWIYNPLPKHEEKGTYKRNNGVCDTRH